MILERRTESSFSKTAKQKENMDENLEEFVRWSRNVEVEMQNYQ